MSLQISKIAEQTEGSPTMTIDAKVNALKAEGKKVINLAAGAPDFLPPKEVRLALHEAISKGMTRYTDSSGRIDVRQAISDRFQNLWNLSYSAKEQIVITPGGKGAVSFALKAIVNAGDEVIIIAPYWPSYVAMVLDVGAKPVFFNPWLQGFSAIDKVITAQTKAVIINSPVNPTGNVYSGKDFQDLAKVLAETDIWVISDEIYACIEYEIEKHQSLAHYPGMVERVIICDGASKAFAMPGLRMGWAAGPAIVILAMQKMLSQLIGCPDAISQEGLLAGLLYSEKEVELMVVEYKRRRDQLIIPFAEDMKKNVPGFDYIKPLGAFYWWFRLPPKYKEDSEQFCLKFLEKKGVGLVPGSAFLPKDDPEKGWVRLSYAASEEEIRKALGFLAEFMT